MVTIISLTACHEGNAQKEKMKRWVGDISYNQEQDNHNFVICNGKENILQYFNLGNGPSYLGGKPELVKRYKSQYSPVKGHEQNGFIRIRFIVNCEGKAGRFRMIQSDRDYQEMSFDDKITTQLMDITKKIEEWLVMYRKDDSVDYYMYLIFKIKDGEILEILP